MGKDREVNNTDEDAGFCAIFFLIGLFGLAALVIILIHFIF
jgi:hypothetical protein